MKDQTKDSFVKIQKIRYRLATIKRYEPFETESPKNDKYGLYVYFAVTGSNSRVYHYFEKEEDRDKMIRKLDELFGVSY